MLRQCEWDVGGEPYEVAGVLEIQTRETGECQPCQRGLPDLARALNGDRREHPNQPLQAALGDAMMQKHAWKLDGNHLIFMRRLQRRASGRRAVPLTVPLKALVVRTNANSQARSAASSSRSWSSRMCTPCWTSR